MKNEKRVVYEVQMLNTKDLEILRKLESDGIIKRVNVCKDGSLDMRMVKK